MYMYYREDISHGKLVLTFLLYQWRIVNYVLDLLEKIYIFKIIY